MDGANLTLASTLVTAQSGAFNVTVDDSMSVNTKVTGGGVVSKTGDGTLILGGTLMNTNLSLAVGAGSLELNKTGAADAYAVDTLDVASGASVALTGSNGNQINGDVILSGGMLDLGGHSETIGALSSADASSAVVNNGTAAELSVGVGDGDSEFAGLLSDGSGVLSLTKIGAGTQAISAGSIAYSGETVVEAGVLRLLSVVLPITDGLSYQLDASDISTLTLDGANVTGWVDAKNSGMNFTQSDSALQPIYEESAINGLPAVRFGLNGNTRMVADRSVKARTVFIVSEMLNYVGLAGVWGMSGVDKGLRHASSSSWRHTGNSADANDFTYNGVMRINGEPGFTWDASPHVMTAVSTEDRDWTTAIGNYWSVGNYGLARYLRGYIAEIIVYERALSGDELKKVEAYLAWKWLHEKSASVSTLAPVTISHGAKFAVNGWGLIMEELSGSGDLAVESGSLSITNYAAFTGTVSGDGALALSATDGADAKFVPRSQGLTVCSDGAAAVNLVIDTAGTNNFMVGALEDGRATMGLIHSGGGTTLMSGINSSYTGDTLLENGVAVVGSIAHAKFVRFSPQMTRFPAPGQHPDTGYQLSEFHVMLSGEKVEYPAGTQARSPGVVPDGREDPVEAIDGSVDTKFYVGFKPLRPLIIEFPEPVTFNGYRWYTANDANGRDPVVWTVDISDDGVSWTTVDSQDYSANQGDITTSRHTQVGTWRMNIGSDMNVFSDISATTLVAPGQLSISSVTETVGALSGDGEINLSDGALGVNAFEDAIFTGNISGSGSIVKKGSETQTLSGALSVSGELVVEAGVLDLEGAALTGITNIVIKTGGELTGSAAVNGDLTVTFEGGVYSATLAVSGSLTTGGSVRLGAPAGATYPLRQLLFSYASAGQSTRDALANAVLTTSLPPGNKASVRLTATSAKLVVAPDGSILMLR